MTDISKITHGLCELHHGDAAAVLKTVASNSVQVVVTSPPYNIGKAYESRTSLEEYLAFQEGILRECHRVLATEGSLCLQVGNHVRDGEILPLDSVMIPLLRELGMKIRNRIVWTFGHGLHCSKRLSGRHETIVWATKTDAYHFDLDAIRVPQKYPGKRYFKGPRKGELSGNPLGKNPGDVWDISNVKHKHPEKTAHPCQFPEGLVDRLVRSLSKPGDTVLDPFSGSGTVGAVCNRLGRRSILIEQKRDYVAIAEKRLAAGSANDTSHEGFASANEPPVRPHSTASSLYRPRVSLEKVTAIAGGDTAIRAEVGAHVFDRG
jgi:adenine-specific DNA-methyltransferase